MIQGGYSGLALTQDDQYVRDAIGSVTSIVDATANTKECFLYDSRNRLVRAHTATIATACLGNTTDLAVTTTVRGVNPYDLVYQFDSINRLTGRSDMLATVGGVATFTYPTSGARPHAVTQVTTTTDDDPTIDDYEYGPNGAMTKRDGADLDWDPQQRLTAYTYDNEDDDEDVFEYWTSNQRVQRQAGTVRTVYLPGLDITIQGANRTITKQITIDGAVIASKQLDGGGVWWNCADMQNSTSCATQPGNTTGINKHDYLPYGTTRGTNTITHTDRGFLNQPEDTTGLTYLNNRYHDPQLAAFISVDPLVGQTGHPYLYGNGNASTLSDPSGLDPKWAYDDDPCTDNGYYECATPKAGPNAGKQVVVGPGARQCAEIPWSAGCSFSVTGSDGSIIEIQITQSVSDSVQEGLEELDPASVGLIGACGSLFGGFGFFAQGELCALGDFEDLSLQATGEAATGAGMSYGGSGGLLISNADDSDSLLGWSACVGASGSLGVGLSGELCFSLTSDLKGAEPTGVWTFYGGGTFGSGAEAHVGLAHTVEVFKASDAVCWAVAGPLYGLVFC